MGDDPPLFICVCVCVCPSRRQSEKMLELVKMFLMKLPGAAERIVKKNRERLWLRGDAHRAEDVRKCSSYPSKVSTLKGVARRDSVEDLHACPGSHCRPPRFADRGAI